MHADQAAPPVPAEWKLPSSRKVAICSLIATESALFSIFVVAYVFYIGRSLNPPYPSQVLDFPLLATIFLLSSSFTVVVAEKAFAKSRAKFHIWWGVTILLGLAFLIYTGIEWYRLIVHDGLLISTNVFGSTFYSLVGLHASHVIVGLILLSMVGILSLFGKVGDDKQEHIEMISWYWHFVDAVWIVVVTVVYIISVQAQHPL